MKIPGILIIAAMTLQLNAWGQKVVSKYYCQGCCSGANEFYLKLDSDNRFEVYYFLDARNIEKTAFGIGTYKVSNDIMLLTFETILPPRIEVEKLNSSDSLIIDFSVFDNIKGDSLPAVTVYLRNRNSELFYITSTGTVKAKFVNAETVSFFSMGFEKASYTIKEPGKYRMRAMLNPEGKVKFNQGEEKRYKIVKTKESEQFIDLDERKIRFTTISCGR